MHRIGGGFGLRLRARLRRLVVLALRLRPPPVPTASPFGARIFAAEICERGICARLRISRHAGRARFRRWFRRRASLTLPLSVNSSASAGLALAFERLKIADEI